MSKTQTETKHRLLKISILRYNPQDPDSVPHMQTYELEEGDRMTLFIALNDLRDEPGSDAAVRLRLPRWHLRFLRDA